MGLLIELECLQDLLSSNLVSVNLPNELLRFPFMKPQVVFLWYEKC